MRAATSRDERGRPRAARSWLLAGALGALLAAPLAFAGRGEGAPEGSGAKVEASGKEKVKPGAGASDGASTKTKAPACRRDTDCVLVPDDCCKCAAGGKQRAIPVKERAAYLRALAQRCEGTMCTEMMSNDPSCAAAARAVCRDAVCTLGDLPAIK